MSETKPVAASGLTEILAAWEGPAIHEADTLFEEKQDEYLAGDGDAAALAAWIAVTALGGFTGNSATLAIRAKVLGVLANWRQRFGQAKIDEIKQQLVQKMHQQREQRKITDAELRERIELVIDQIPR